MTIWGTTPMRAMAVLSSPADGLLLFGAATRSSETERKRKPPGTI